MSEPKPEREHIYVAMLLQFGEFTYHVDWWDHHEALYRLVDAITASADSEHRRRQFIELINEYEQWCADLNHE